MACGEQIVDDFELEKRLASLKNWAVTIGHIVAILWFWVFTTPFFNELKKLTLLPFFGVIFATAFTIVSILITYKFINKIIFKRLYSYNIVIITFASIVISATYEYMGQPDMAVVSMIFAALSLIPTIFTKILDCDERMDSVDKKLVTLCLALFVISMTVWIVKPNVRIYDVEIYPDGINLKNLTLTLKLDKSNDIALNINKIYYNVYFLNQYDSKFTSIGDGESTEKNEWNYRWKTVSIPTRIKNETAFKILYQNYTEYKPITIKVNGSIFLDLKISSYEIPFETTKEIKKSDYEPSSSSGDSSGGPGWVPVETECRRIGTQLVCNYRY